jgi:O-antigen ligase/polysaccharide polymerase Wzy-like membrane protein
MSIFKAKRSIAANNNLVFQATVLAILCAFLLIGKQVSLVLLGILIVAWILALIAYRLPYLIIVLVFFLGQLIGQEAQIILPEYLREPDFGFLKLRYFDPILLGMVLAIFLKLLHRNTVLLQFCFRKYFFWTILLMWLSIEIVRSFGNYGIINILGEFRTYYQYLLFIPYIIVFFETEDKQWRLFKLLMVLSFLFVLSAIVRGWILHDLEIGIGKRWFSSSANLALLSGATALYLSVKNDLLKVNNSLLTLLFVPFFVLTVLNGHRSVWLATIATILLLILTGQISFRSMILTWIAGIAACAVVLYSFQMQGENLSLFLDKRIMAFTDYRYDPTANWRYALWLESLSSIYQHPFAGQGLGRHFQFHSFSKEINTSPHNLYITIAYQTGITGLLLYSGFICQVFLRFRKALQKTLSLRQRTMIMAAVVIFISSSVYYMAYVFDYFTWLYVGLGISAALTRDADILSS